MSHLHLKILIDSILGDEMDKGYSINFHPKARIFSFSAHLVRFHIFESIMSKSMPSTCLVKWLNQSLYWLNLLLR